MRSRTEDVFELVLLEDARRAAIHQHEHLFQLLGRRRHGEAITRADVAENRVDVIALERVAQLLDLLGGAAGLVDQIDFDLEAAEPDLVVGLDHGSGVERVDHRLGAVPCRLAERFRGRSGQEGDNAELEYLLVLGRRAGRQCTKRRGTDQTASGKSTIVHGLDLPWRIVGTRPRTGLIFACR